MQEEKGRVYIIPHNFEEKGGIFGGKIKLRNSIETAIVFIVLFKVGGALLYSIDFTVKMILFVVFVVPLTLLAFIGLFGDSLSEFILNLLSYRLGRRVMSFRLPNDSDIWINPPEETKLRLNGIAKLQRLKRSQK